MTVSTDCTVDLYVDGILWGSLKPIYFEALFEPFEGQLNLLFTFVMIDHFKRYQRDVVFQKYENSIDCSSFQNRTIRRVRDNVSLDKIPSVRKYL